MFCRYEGRLAEPFLANAVLRVCAHARMNAEKLSPPVTSAKHLATAVRRKTHTSPHLPGGAGLCPPRE